MLVLKNIKKEYKVADQKIEALKGINLAFRKNEFVSILGPSGCGKTTTLNIIGGLDRYTSGDLFINGRSTKEFKDKDWDIYRNHRVGFIFQAYNLIPHQTILENVELALTIAGISQKERVERAKKALDEVGLKGQYNKKPNQLSGGQCQRVAIARALVNEPEILLADEPTGALDTQTSIQIMDLIKKISNEKLVIMVTHNPELAEKYSTRIIKLLDGEVLSDSNPYSFEDEKKEEVKKIENEKAKMSWWTSFKLSSRNLLSKKGRSILISLAGSIGIIGVASVISVSTGVNEYISDMQDDMLSGNPIQISESTYDLNSLTNLMTAGQKATIAKEIAKGNVNVEFLLDQILEMVNAGGSVSVKNEITDDYINYVLSMPSDYYSDISFKYGYDLGDNIYTSFTSKDKDSSGNIVDTTKIQSLNSIVENYNSVLSKVEGFDKTSSYITGLVTPITQLTASNSYIETQYDILTGHLPENENELLLVLDSDEQVSDVVLAELGYYTQDEFITLAKNSMSIANKEEGATHDNDKSKFDYDTILNHEFYYAPTSSIYKYNTNSFDYTYDITDTKSNYQKLKISGIVKLKSGRNYGCLSTGLHYTKDLALKMHSDVLADVARATTDNPTFSAYVYNMSKLSTTGTIVNGPNALTYHCLEVKYTYNFYNYTDNVMVEGQTGYVGTTDSTSTFLSTFIGGSSGSTSAGTTKYLSSRSIGLEEKPTTINIYPTSFDEKNKVTDYLDLWNDFDKTITVNGKDIESRSKVTYTDSVGTIISMVKTLINVVTYALIAFTALSLVVSCFMIAIITYVSVMERVKEIGVIRSLGGRKKDVSHLFNAETFILGLSSGLIGVLVTYLITLILNLSLHSMVGANIACFWPYQALIMILLSIALTLISGAVPARSAAKQDPVNALRSE